MNGSVARRGLGWGGTGALVALAARTLAYAVAPASPAAARLSGELGGPAPVLAAAGALAVAVALAAAILWLGSIGAAERALSAGGPAPARLRVAPVLARAASLFAFSALLFAAIESYLHVRQGLGFHGLHCLLGPAHRDVLPFLAALSLLAAALHDAVAHVLGAARRAAATLLAAPSALPLRDERVCLGVGARARARRRLVASVRRPRGPPASRRSPAMDPTRHEGDTIRWRQLAPAPAGWRP